MKKEERDFFPGFSLGGAGAGENLHIKRWPLPMSP